MAAALRHRDRPGDLAREGRFDFAAGEQAAGGDRPGAMRVAPDIMAPAADAAVGAQRGFQLDHHRRAERLPAMLLLAHPLQAHGTAGHRTGGKGCVGGNIVGAIVAVTARAFGMDAAHLVCRQAQQLGQGLAQRIDALAVRPHRDAVILPERHGAGWPDRPVHQAWPAVARLDDLAIRGRRRPGIVEDRHFP